MPPRAKSAPKKTARSASSAARLRQVQDLVRDASGERAEPFSSLNPCFNEVVSPAALRNLSEYQYSTTDLSLMQKYCGLQKMWNWQVTFVPYWMAPNMLTLMALACSMSYPLMVAYYDYQGVDVPNWVWLFSAVALYCYQTLDSLDGKHARRTDAKGALGEMFDHGCDMLFTPFMLYASGRCIGFAPQQVFVFTLVSLTGVYVTMLEQFLCGSLELGYLNGPTEGVYFGITTYLWTYLQGGTSYWATKLASPITLTMPPTLVAATKTYAESFQIPPSITLASTRGDIAYLFFFGLVIAVVGAQARSAYQKLKPNMAAPIRSYIVNITVTLIWGLYAFFHPASAYKHVSVNVIVYGIYFAYAATSLTVQRLCKQDAIINWVMVALVTWMPLVKLVRRDRFCLSGYAFPTACIVLLFYVHFLISIFFQFARALDINIITLTPAQVKVSKKRQEDRIKNGEW